MFVSISVYSTQFPLPFTEHCQENGQKIIPHRSAFCFPFECRFMIPNLSRMDDFWWWSASYTLDINLLICLHFSRETPMQHHFLGMTVLLCHFGFIPLMDHFTVFFSLNRAKLNNRVYGPPLPQSRRMTSGEQAYPVEVHKSCVQHLEK